MLRGPPMSVTVIDSAGPEIYAELRPASTSSPAVTAIDVLAWLVISPCWGWCTGCARSARRLR
jgi:hypothetical protein